MGYTKEQLVEKAKKKLDGVQIDLANKTIQLVEKAYDAGIQILITQGYRSIAYQNQLYAQGRTKAGQKVTNARGGYSYHNFGLAVDFAVLRDNGSINWTVNNDWFKVGAIGESLGLEWGGRWTSFKDYPHFQLDFGMSTAQLRAGRRPSNYRLFKADKGYLEKGDQGNEVKELQENLNFIGIDVGKSDGIFGNDTLTGVLLLQKRKGLEADGLAGKSTIAVLNKLVEEKKKELEAAKEKVQEIVEEATGTKLAAKEDEQGTYRIFTGTFGDEESLKKAASQIGYNAFIKEGRVWTGAFTSLSSAEKAREDIAKNHGYNPQIRKEK